MCLSWFQKDGWGQKKLEEPQHGWEVLFRKSTPNFNMQTWKATLSGPLSMFPYDVCSQCIGYVYHNSVVSVKCVSAVCDSFSKDAESRVCVGCCPRMEMQLLASWSLLSRVPAARGYQQVWFSMWTIGKWVGRGGPDVQKCWATKFWALKTLEVMATF